MKPVLPLLLATLAIGGCSLVPWGKDDSPRGKVSINWSCVADPETGQQTCEKRRMRGGKPVDSEVFETIVIPGHEAPPPVLESAHNPPANAGNAVPWGRQPLAAVNTIDDPADLNVENLGPELKEARATADIWGKSGGEKSVAESGGDGYTLQMGAFSTPERCDAFIVRHVSAALPMSKKVIAGTNNARCIVLHGNFASRKEAQGAAREREQKYPHLAFWVRSWDSIRELEAAGD